MNYLTILLILLVYPSLLLADKTNSCLRHKTCGECITDSAVCDWCASTNEEFDNQPRCRLKGSYQPKWCSGSLDIPENGSSVATVNINFSSAIKNVVQIKPQQYNVKLRPGQPVDFTFSFEGAKNYPVDLYMLLDASETMDTIKKKISRSSEHIYNTMIKITENVNMGIGTFVDKNTLPFKEAGQQVYSFKNELNLTSDYKKFKEVVDNIKIAGNFDIPDGGFDALAQVMTCNVGWRDKSRKVIVFFTDSSHHAAGDGLVAGIFKPYDGKCYTDSAGVYTNELIMDYPSVPMIKKLAYDNEVTIIFAIHEAKYETYQPLYMSLKNIIGGSKMAMLKKDDENKDIASLLEESYREISTNVVLKVQVASGHRRKFEITFNPSCIKSDEHLSYCQVEPGARLNFKGTITLSEYYKKDKEVIDISVQGINETLRLNVDVIKCPCEEKEERTSDYCNNQRRQCGACICDGTTSGNRCMCKKGVTDNSDKDNTKSCIRPGQSKKCSGEGQCKCGLCECPRNKYFGRFCECAYSRCPGYEVTSNGISFCGGHGTCNCGEVDVNGRKEVCTCDKGWTHKPGAEILGCTCRNATDSCITYDPKTTICNERGKCSCDSCQCEPIAKWDKRVEQDIHCWIKPCPACHSSQCTSLRSCVSCIMNSEKCTEDCNGVSVEQKYYELPKEYMNNEWSLCDNQIVNLGCYTKFVYKYDEEEYRILLRMEESSNCAQNYYMYGGILLATLLIVGILTLLVWKGLTNYRDRKEFMDFEKKHKKLLDRPSQNPLYDEPTTTFRNPAFKRSING